MGQDYKHKRRVYLIDKDFQFKYLLTWLLLTMSLVGGMVLATLTLFFFFKGSLSTYTIEINTTLAVILTGLSLYYMVRHSHRIAGPAYRLECIIHELAQGRYDLSRKVYLRRKDYLKHVAEALNELIETRADEQDRLMILLAGMCELDSEVQATANTGPEVKELSRRMFAEIVELAGSTQTPEMRNCIVTQGFPTGQDQYEPESAVADPTLAST